MKAKVVAKTLVNGALGLVGLELHRKPPDHPKPLGDRPTLEGAIQHAIKLGFNPKTVIDVGAAIGTPELYQNFPTAKHILIEPLEEHRPYLEKVTSDLPGSEFLIAAAQSVAGTAVVHVHPDLQGSSLYMEQEDSDVNGTPRTVPAVTLNDVCEQRKCRGPYLIKIDTQGSELDVLRGAGDVLKETEYIVVEVSLFEFFKGGPQIFEVMSFMKANGFVVYEALGYLYRPLDGAMAQMDLVFVKESGPFRKQQCFATSEQRREQTERLLGMYPTS